MGIIKGNRKTMYFARLLLFPVTLLVVSLLSSSSALSPSHTSSSYSIIGLYESVSTPSGTKALDSFSTLREVKTVFLPTKVDLGKYTVEITRIDSNFYRIIGTDLYIETQGCYEYAIREEVVVSITSQYGYTKGEVIFF